MVVTLVPRRASSAGCNADSKGANDRGRTRKVLQYSLSVFFKFKIVGLFPQVNYGDPPIFHQAAIASNAIIVLSSMILEGSAMARAVIVLLFCSFSAPLWSQEQHAELVPTVKLTLTEDSNTGGEPPSLEHGIGDAPETTDSKLFAPLPLDLVFQSGCDSPGLSSTNGSSCCPQCEAACVDCFRGLCDPPCCHRSWVAVDFLTFFSGGFDVPELVAQSAPGTPRAQVGILGDPATSILLGNESLGDDGLIGARIRFGRWLDDSGNSALVASLLGFGNESSSTFPTDSNTIVSRPFFNVDPNVNALDAELVNYPGVVSGSIGVLADTNAVSLALGIQRALLCCNNRGDHCRSRRFDAYLGIRSFAFDEELAITERLLASGGLIPANTTFDVVDRFETENQFVGLEAGLSGKWQQQRWIFEVAGRVALGNLDQDVIITGSTTVTVPGQPAVIQPYGILAGTSNIGTYERDHLGVLSQINASVAYQLSRRWKATLGYTFFMLNDVVRPGDLIDLNVNGTHIDPNVPDSGPSRPSFDWVSETLLLHGLNAGVEFAF